MSDAVILAIIAGVPATIAALGALIVSILTFRKTEVIHKATNSMKDALVAAATKEGHAAGVAEGVAATVAGRAP